MRSNYIDFNKMLEFEFPICSSLTFQYIFHVYSQALAATVRTCCIRGVSRAPSRLLLLVIIEKSERRKK